MPAPSLMTRLARKGRHLNRALRLRASLRRLHGPARFDLAPGDVVVVALVKDGAYYLDAFFAHYRRLGARHFVFIDNGSTDATLARVRAEVGTVILRSTLPMATFESRFRRHAARTYGRNRWVLFADMDEQFDFEGSAVLGLSGLTEYLRANRFTALMAQMLEMFPEGSIRSHAHAPFEQVIAAYRHYDLTAIRRFDYDDYDNIPFSYFLRMNTVSNPALQFMFGGVRLKVFGEMCCMTKHPLVLVDDTTWPNPHPHTAAHVRVADFSALIRHYKFANDPFARDRQSLRDGIIPHGEDRQRLDVVRTNPDVSLFSDDALRYCTVEALYRQGFLTPSPAFSQFVAARRGQPALAPSHPIAAVVIGRNEGTRLIAGLDALAGRVARVIYVDSGSTDDSVAAARARGAEVVALDLSRPFTAARARNAGLALLDPEETPLVQLLDGDCVLRDGWLDTAAAFLAANPDTAVVCGRRRERHPEASIYNALCDAEWNTPVGPAKACGGDALMRLSALAQVGGFRDDLIAGEEPELCVRLRSLGWAIHRLDAEMTWHDAAITRFSQWWRRSQRAGHAFAEGAALHGAPPERHWVRETRRALIWGAALPAVAVSGALITPWALLLLATYPAQIARLTPRLGLAGAAFAVLGKLPEAQGALAHSLGRARGKRRAILEYKR